MIDSQLNDKTKFLFKQLVSTVPELASVVVVDGVPFKPNTPRFMLRNKYNKHLCNKKVKKTLPPMYIRKTNTDTK